MMNLVRPKPAYAEAYPWPEPMLYIGDVGVPFDPEADPIVYVNHAVIIDGLSILHYFQLDGDEYLSDYFDTI